MSRFEDSLILNQWMLAQFGAEDLTYFKNIIADDDCIGFTEEGSSKFLSRLLATPESNRTVSNDMLMEFDDNIVRWWKDISKKRNTSGHYVYPLYFQYLSLLFTEYYLDRYMSNKRQLCMELNEFLANFNDKNSIAEKKQLPPFIEGDLNKLAVWIATGGGKTLLMHVNALQFKHYSRKYFKNNEFNKIILLTPNEGLSKQHEKEFRKSGIGAQMFDPDRQGSLFSGEVDIIDIHKLKEKKGEKTVAVESFESNNLVLVDEGHRGTSGDEWLSKRNQICENGFSFEYSATFGQAIKSTAKSKQKTLHNLYSKCIMFDYSYRFFHEDGYGKDHSILNLSEERIDEQRQLYLTACLLSFFEQKKYYKENSKNLVNYLLEDPLWIFVGGSVTGNRANAELTDVQQILLFLSKFLKNTDNQSVKNIEKLLSRSDDLRSTKGGFAFHNMFNYLISSYQSNQSPDVFKELIELVFNSFSPGILQIVSLKGTGGEIGLRVGMNDYFGIINVGDPRSLLKLCDENMGDENILVTSQVFSESLFTAINGKESKVNMLIGAKKFSEGWSSWRVSTMGLMNIGRSEGSEIIQLFGRGIRLRGHGFSLKRSDYVTLESGDHPKNIRILENLNVFGIRSNYMEEFEEYLKEEGVDTSETEIITLPVIQPDLPNDLHVIKADNDMPEFKKMVKPLLAPPDDSYTGKVILDWYPKIQSRRSRGAVSNAGDLNEGKLNKSHLEFLNFDEIYFNLNKFKNEKARYNIQLNRENLYDILINKDWYVLYIPSYVLEIGGLDKIFIWQEIAQALLKKYLERFYVIQKNIFEAPYLKYYKLEKNDKNFIKEYKAVVKKSEESLINRLKEFSAILNSGEENISYPLEFGKLKLFKFDQHLYEPLVKFTNDEVLKISPVAMNQGEHDFVEDLKKFHTQNAEMFKGNDLFLLRNQAKTGVGFFLEGNFYPDFILWIKKNNSKQYVSFIDPKGLRNIKGFSDPKINFCKKIKEIEGLLKNEHIILNSFIVSNTPREQIKWWGSSEGNEDDFQNNHILFQDENNYLKDMFSKILAQ